MTYEKRGLIALIGTWVIGFILFLSMFLICRPDTPKELLDQIEVDIDMTHGLDESTVETGQIWLSETENPFHEDIYWYIVEIKADYVVFTSVKYNKDKNLWVIPEQIPYTTSSKINIFKNIYVRVK